MIFFAQLHTNLVPFQLKPLLEATCFNMTHRNTVFNVAFLCVCLWGTSITSFNLIKMHLSLFYPLALLVSADAPIALDECSLGLMIAL